MSSVKSPTKTSTDVRSPTSTKTSTWAKTQGNVTVTGGAGDGDTIVNMGGAKDMAEGGEVQDDDDELMNHVAMEAINAVHAKDSESYRNAFHALVAHTLYRMSDEMESNEGDE